MLLPAGGQAGTEGQMLLQYSFVFFMDTAVMVRLVLSPGLDFSFFGWRSVAGPMWRERFTGGVC